MVKTLERASAKYEWYEYCTNESDGSRSTKTFEGINAESELS